MGDRTVADIGDDLHTMVHIRIEISARDDPVIVPYAQGPDAHAVRGVAVRETEMEVGVQPLVLEPAKRLEGEDVDGHRYSIFEEY